MSGILKSDAPEAIYNLHLKYVRNTAKKAIVINAEVFLCNLTKKVIKDIHLKADRIYVKTRVLKHLYDKRPAQEYDFLLENIYLICRYPTRIYQNRNNKTGDYCFFKVMHGIRCLCILESVEDERMNIVTFFFLQNDLYLNNYKLLWNREDGSNLHRNAFDSESPRSSSTPQ